MIKTKSLFDVLTTLMWQKPDSDRQNVLRDCLASDVRSTSLTHIILENIENKKKTLF